MSKFWFFMFLNKIFRICVSFISLVKENIYFMGIWIEMMRFSERMIVIL